MVELGEVRDILGVSFQDRSSLHALNLVLLDIRNPVLEEKRIDTFVLIVRTNGDKEHIEGINLLGFESLENMVPTEGEEFAATFTECLGYIRHTDTDTYHFVFLVHNDSHEIEVQQRELHILVVVLLLVGHRLEVIEFLVRFVNDIHILNAIFAH